jgi:hypothetical protein
MFKYPLQKKSIIKKKQTIKKKAIQNMERSEINATYKWDLSELYPDEKSFLADCEKVQKMTSEIKKQEETMTKGARQLAEILIWIHAIMRHKLWPERYPTYVPIWQKPLTFTVISYCPWKKKR